MVLKEHKNLGTYKTKQELSQLIRMPFEDMEVSVPIGWHTYLKRQYGDYMKLPPVEKQKGHHSSELPDPFTPCQHIQTLEWKNRNVVLPVNAFEEK